jgi:hypothetical protein
MSTDLCVLLSEKFGAGLSTKDIYTLHIAKKPKPFVDGLIAGLRSNDKRIKNKCAELCSLVSADNPKLLYVYLGLFSDNLSSKDAMVRWEAACTLGNFAKCDSKKLLPPLIPALASLLTNKSIVLQGHVVKALGKIAGVYPTEAAGILGKLLASRRCFPGNRIGYLVDAMEYFLVQPALRKKASCFVARLADNEAGTISRKALRILKLAGRK